MIEYKGYNIVQLRTFPMVQIKNIGQGPCPRELEGLYTTITVAMKAIDSFLFSKTKGVKDAKTNSSGKG